jgi:ABC-type glycerol-3-phosphate transport system substrate-binding protein
MGAKIRSSLSAGKGAHGFTTPGTTIMEWVLPGNLQPVSPDVVTVAQVRREQLPENILQCQIDGQVWAIGIPDSPGDIGLAVNADHLKEVGLPLIGKFDSMEQLFEYAKALAIYEDGKLMRGGCSFQEPNDPMFFYSFIVDQGGRFWDNDTQKFTLQTPEARNALQAIHDLFYRYELDSVELPDTITALGQNLSSMGFIWAEFVYFAQLIFPDLHFEFIMKPSFTGTKPPVFNHTDTWNVVVPSYVSGVERDALFEFLRYLISEEGQLTFLESGYTGLSPLRSIVFDHSYYKTGPGKSMAPVIDAMTKGSYMYYGPFIDADIMLYDIMWPIIDEVIHNQISIDDALAKMENELNDRNARTMEKYPDAPKTIIDWDGLEF